MQDLHVVTASDGSSLMTVADVAAYLSVKPSWVYEAVRSKALPHFKIGNHLRFRREAIDTWLNDNYKGAL